ncbi:MAG: cysteine--tRNA ligase [Wenzhouxiangellaceae bacterium]
MSIEFYNTLTHRKEPFSPLDPERVTLYACGPTVYNYAHIGNARPAVIFDLLRQVLKAHYPQVVYARNITDVDDRINARAADTGVDISVISQCYTKAYHDDMAMLGVEPPDIEPFATQHIPQIIALIERLIERGCAYEAEGHVLFDVDAFDDYGALSHRDQKEMLAGARVEVAPYKRNPGDFVLWKPSTPPLPSWDSPWGGGRPGWHIECSAMCAAHLGEVIDIHAGGQDLVFPHHENEIAQSRCAFGHDHFARYWMHNGFLTVSQRKMSKSIGNVLLVRELGKHYPGEVLRYVLLSAHYRQPLDWSETALDQARRTLDRLYAGLRDNPAAIDDSGPPDDDFLQLLANDLNTPMALAEINRLGRESAHAGDSDEGRRLRSSLVRNARFIGLLKQSPEQWFTWRPEAMPEVDELKVESLICARDQARGERNWAEADRIRDELKAMNIVLEDGPRGTRWRVVEA